MGEVSRNADLSAVSLDQLIDAASAHVKYWNTTISLLGEFNEGIFLIEQRLWVLDQHMPRPVRAIGAADRQVAIRDRIFFESNQLRDSQPMPEANQEQQPIPFPVRLGGRQEHQELGLGKRFSVFR
jgi:hypothetical protein